MADCDTCGFNINGKCRVPDGETLTLDMIDMDSDCDEWCDKESKEHTKSLEKYKKQFPLPTKLEFCKIIGSKSFDAVTYLLMPPATVMANSTDQDIQKTALNNAATLLSAINPQDELESMLATQMIGIHDLAMKKMVSCVSEDRLDAVNLKVNQITKLTRTFIAQMDTLNKHRGKGQQKMTVEHIHVNEGGQAVIGTVEKGEGG